MKQPPRRAGARVAVALTVLAAHLALLLWWLQADRLARREPAVASRVAVRLIVPPQPVIVPPQPVTAPRQSTPPLRSSRAVPAPRAVTAAPAPTPPQAITINPLPAEATASQAIAEPTPSLLDSDATRRALRASAREPGLAAQAGRQGAPLQTPTEKLGEQVQRSAKGDCLKGEYTGGGMGLLSLPFLAAAALNGDCRR